MRRCVGRWRETAPAGREARAAAARPEVPFHLGVARRRRCVGPGAIAAIVAACPEALPMELFVALVPIRAVLTLGVVGAAP